jgi:hypothetical protein
VRRLYGCVYYHKRGTAICCNSRQIPIDVLDSAVLHGLHEALDQRILEEAVRRALERIRTEETKFPEQRLKLQRELSLIETRLHHLVEAVANGQGTHSVFTSLHAEEERKKILLHQLAELNDREKVVYLDAKRLLRELQARIGDLQALLGRNRAQARAILKKLVEGHIICEPILDEDGRPGFRFSATGTYRALLAASVGTNDNGGGQGI